MTASSNQSNAKITQIASLIEHTLLGENIDEARVRAHLEEAKSLGVLAVCLPLAWVSLAKKIIGANPIKVVTVIDFPLGEKSSSEKAQEARIAADLGADEIDMVLDYQALINLQYAKVLHDIMEVIRVTKPITIKVIVETSALNHDQLVAAITIVGLANADFIKTSTGFHKSGAQTLDIALMRRLLAPNVGIKASGGIRDYHSACKMIEAGANRIGTSKSKEILSKLFTAT